MPTYVAMTITQLDPVAERFEAARIAAGLSMSKVERRIVQILGEDAPTEQTLRNYHHQMPPQPNLIVLCAIAHVYGLDPYEVLPQPLLERLEKVQSLLSRSRCLCDTCWSDGVPLQFDLGLQIAPLSMVGDPFAPFHTPLAS